MIHTHVRSYSVYVLMNSSILKFFLSCVQKFLLDLLLHLMVLGINKNTRSIVIMTGILYISAFQATVPSFSGSSVWFMSISYFSIIGDQFANKSQASPGALLVLYPCLSLLLPSLSPGLH